MNVNSEKSRQLAWIFTVIGGIAVGTTAVITFLKFKSEKKKSKLEIQKLNMEIKQMQERNKAQHPKG
jgi:mannitol-specific phosphotransferase system IIBC component